MFEARNNFNTHKQNHVSRKFGNLTQWFGEVKRTI